MPLVKAKCTNCGGVLDVENSNEAAICQYCGTPFIVEKAINNYVQNISIQNATINVQGNVQGPNVDNYIQLIEDSLNANNIEEAESQLKNALPLEPRNNKLIELRNRINGRKLINKYYFDAVGACEILKNDSLSVYEHLKARDIMMQGGSVKWEEQEFKNFTKDFLASSKIIDKSDENFTNEFFWQPFAIYNDLLKVLDSLNYAAEKTFKQSPAKANKIHPYYRYDTLFIEIYNILINPELPEKIMDKELCFLYEREKKNMIDNPGTTSRGTSFLWRYTSELGKDKLAEPPIKAKNKKGVEINAIHLGDYLIYHIKQNYPNYKSEALNEMEKITNEMNKSGCYVATCVYGSYDCPEVWTLRRFRDYTLDKTWYGRAFIKTYYATSPTIVKLFGDYSLFKNIFKKPLDKMVYKLKSAGYEDTPYNDKY